MEELIQKYIEEKAKLDVQKKTVDRLNAKIKLEMAKLKVTEADCGEYTIAISEINRDKLNEQMLIEKLSSPEFDSIRDKVVAYVPKISLDSLEDLIYNRILNADAIKDCIEHNEPTIRLNVKRRKERQEE